MGRRFFRCVCRCCFHPPPNPHFAASWFAPVIALIVAWRSHTETFTKDNDKAKVTTIYFPVCGSGEPEKRCAVGKKTKTNMLQPTQLTLMMRETPILHKASRYSTGVNQFGLKPDSTYDVMNPTNLINHGKGTSFDRLDVRRGEFRLRRSATSLHGMALGKGVNDLLGVNPAATQHSLSFCTAEAAALRACMAKGDTCDNESRIYDACIDRVGALRAELQGASSRFYDWYVANVSDNFTKPFQHRRHDHRQHYATEQLVMARKQGGVAFGKRPKNLDWRVKTMREPGSGARRSRFPINK